MFLALVEIFRLVSHVLNVSSLCSDATSMIINFATNLEFRCEIMVALLLRIHNLIFRNICKIVM